MVKSIPSVKMAFRILRLFSDDNTARGVNELARKLEINPSSCFNLVKTLLHESMLDIDSVTKKYSLGHGIANLAFQAKNGRKITDIAAPFMDTLTGDFEITAGLWRVDIGQRWRLLASSESRAAARISMTIGQRLPLLAGANGRAFLINNKLDNKTIKSAYSTIIWQAPLPLKKYLKHVTQAKQAGFAVDNGYLFKGVTSISVPIVSPDGDTMFCLSATLFSAQFSTKLLHDLGPRLTEAGQIINTEYFGA